MAREAIPVGISFFDGAGASVLLGVWFPTERGVGRSAPLQLLGATGCERVATLSRSPGVVLLRNWFPTKQAVLLRTFVSDGAGVGRSAPLHPLGRRDARGFTPSRALPGAGLAGNWFSAGSGSCSGGNFVSDGTGASVLVGVWFSTARGAGRSAPLQPLGRRVREGCDPLALSREG